MATLQVKRLSKQPRMPDQEPQVGAWASCISGVPARLNEQTTTSRSDALKAACSSRPPTAVWWGNDCLCQTASSSGWRVFLLSELYAASSRSFHTFGCPAREQLFFIWRGCTHPNRTDVPAFGGMSGR
eukprot:6222807-Prymnesium_polylepis.1